MIRGSVDKNSGAEILKKNVGGFTLGINIKSFSLGDISITGFNHNLMIIKPKMEDVFFGKVIVFILSFSMVTFFL